MLECLHNLCQCLFTVPAYDFNSDSAFESAVWYVVYCTSLGQCRWGRNAIPKRLVWQNTETVYAVFRTDQFSVWYHHFLVFVLFPMSDAVWRGYLSAAYRSFPATSVCSSVSDGMVFGIYVDTGFDFTFSANLQDSFFPEQGICTSNFYYSSGDYCFYFPYLCWWCVVVRTDEITPLVFRIFIAGGISLYAVEFSSKIFL